MPSALRRVLDLGEQVTAFVQRGERLDGGGEPGDQAVRAAEPGLGADQRRPGGELLGLGLGVGPALRVGQGQPLDLLQVTDLVPDRQPRPLRLARAEPGQGLIDVAGIHGLLLDVRCAGSAL